MVSKKIGWEITKKAFLPFLIFLCVSLFYAFYILFIAPGVSDNFNANAVKFIKIFFIISVAFFIQRVIHGTLSWYSENIAKLTKTRLDDELIPLFRRTSNILIWAIALLVILPVFGVNISALVATLGVSSLAIALAAKDTIANIISGLMIMIDRPFRPQDKIKLPTGEVVEVLDIGVRRSRFLSDDGSIVIVPNLDLSKSRIINYTYGEEREKKLKP